jgi:hypothetical protein
MEAAPNVRQSTFKTSLRLEKSKNMHAPGIAKLNASQQNDSKTSAMVLSKCRKQRTAANKQSNPIIKYRLIRIDVFISSLYQFLLRKTPFFSEYKDFESSNKMSMPIVLKNNMPSNKKILTDQAD